jgi:hypothetical protein
LPSTWRLVAKFLPSTPAARSVPALIRAAIRAGGRRGRVELRRILEAKGVTPH